jgi:fatty-acyl-CoA synthase
MLSPEEELAASRRLHWMSVLELHALSRGDKEALVDEDRRLNWRQVRDGVHAVAAELQSRGIGRGDRVFIHSFNNVQYVIALVAINAIGAIACPFNIRAAPAELDYLIPDSGAQLGFADDAGAQTLARSEMGQTVPLIRFGEEFADIVESRAEDDLPGAAEDDLPDLAESDTAFIIYTSGTTSAPKGAMLTHLNMISQTINTNRFAPPGGPDDCSMVVVPLFHIAGLGFVYPALLNGVKTVIAPPKVLAHTDALLDLLESEHVTNLFLVPTLWQALCTTPGIEERELSLKGLTWGASPASRETLRLMADTFPNAHINAAFGQTEMSPTTCSLPGDDSLRKMGSVGRPIGLVAARVVDPAGDDVRQGEVGEIVYRGPGFMQGYWNKPERTAEATTDGWFHSGDLVREDDDGFIYIVDRAKDIIISGGENISSVEVEQAVSAHPKVSDASVIGIAHPTWVETPLAIIVPADPTDPPTLDEIRDFLKDRIASFKRPTQLEIVEELPRNASGKLQKHRLREQFAAES